MPRFTSDKLGRSLTAQWRLCSWSHVFSSLLDVCWLPGGKKLPQPEQGAPWSLAAPESLLLTQPCPFTLGLVLKCVSNPQSSKLSSLGWNSVGIPPPWSPMLASSYQDKSVTDGIHHHFSFSHELQFLRWWPELSQSLLGLKLSAVSQAGSRQLSHVLCHGGKGLLQAGHGFCRTIGIWIREWSTGALW
jgi:hypothetical protein